MGPRWPPERVPNGDPWAQVAPRKGPEWGPVMVPECAHYEHMYEKIYK
jgi:hypothetical protein